MRVYAISDKDGQREEDKGNAHVSERVVDGLVGSTVEQLTHVQEWGWTDEGLTPTKDWTFGSRTPSDTGWPTNQGRLGNWGLSLPDPQHKENSMEEPNTKRTLGLDLLEPNTKANGHGPLGAQHKENPGLFREESAHKAEQFTAQLDLDPWAHMPCILKSTLHEPPLGPCLDIEKNRYKNPPPPPPLLHLLFLAKLPCCYLRP